MNVELRGVLRDRLAVDVRNHREHDRTEERGAGCASGERDRETVAVAASSYSPLAPHRYMQKTKTLDFCIVLDGEAVLSSTRRKCPSRRAISSFSVAPATRGAIDRANQRELRSARTMRKLDVRLRGCITSLLAFNGSA